MNGFSSVNLFVFLAICVVALFVVNLTQFVFQRNSFEIKWQPSVATKNNSARLQRPKHKAVVLVYTAFFSDPKWVANQGTCEFIRQRNGITECSLDHFEITYNKTRFSESDLVVFHARNMPSLDELKSLSMNRTFSQRWVYALWESPHATADTRPLNSLFNLTWTYRTDSDFWSPYGRYKKLSPEDVKMNKIATTKDYTVGKTELVAWIVSNCGPQLRMSLVRELKKYIKVDVFGGCSSVFGEPRSCPNSETNNCLKKYKFYLSFENALCEDYITEKYWKHLEGDSYVVPVVMGGAKYSKLAIPGSYINVMDFKTVKQLAEYLQYLDKNDTAFNEFFSWKLKYKVAESLSLSLCQICRGFDPENPPKPRIYDDLTGFWVKDARCNEKEQLVKNMWGT